MISCKIWRDLAILYWKWYQTIPLHTHSFTLNFIEKKVSFEFAGRKTKSSFLNISKIPSEINSFSPMLIHNTKILHVVCMGVLKIYHVSKFFQLFLYWGLKSALRGGETNFWDFLFQRCGHPTQKVGKSQEFSCVYYLKIFLLKPPPPMGWRRRTMIFFILNI